jgi:ferredoxin
MTLEEIMPTRWRIQVDGNLCQGSGVCAGIAPEYFAFGPDDKSYPIQTLVAEAVPPVVECCPSGAISITEEEAE